MSLTYRHSKKPNS